MTVHAPVRPAGVAGQHHILRNTLLLVAAVLVVAGIALVRPTIPDLFPRTTEAEALVEFRAAERAAWANTWISPLTEAQYLVEFRAAERDMR